MKQNMNIGIIGSGIFGLSSAYELNERGHSVHVFEKGTIPNAMASSTDVSKAIRRKRLIAISNGETCAGFLLYLASRRQNSSSGIFDLNLAFATLELFAGD